MVALEKDEASRAILYNLPNWVKPKSAGPIRNINAAAAAVNTVIACILSPLQSVLPSLTAPAVINTVKKLTISIGL